MDGLQYVNNHKLIDLNLNPVHSRIVGESDSWGGAWGVQAGAEALLPFEFKVM